MNIKQEIKDLVRFALTDKTSRNRALHLQQVTEKEAEEIKAITGINVSGYVHTLDKSGINHTIKKHGAGTGQAANGQIEISPEDFELVPDITKPENLIKTYPNRRGEDCFLYEAIYPSGVYYYVEEVRTGRKQLNIQTLFKWKPASKRPAGFRFW